MKVFNILDHEDEDTWPKVKMCHHLDKFNAFEVPEPIKVFVISDIYLILCCL